MTSSKCWPIAASVIAPNLGGIVNGYITRKNIDTWYNKLNKPAWTPPNWVFAPVWTSIYCSVGYASYLVIRDSPSVHDLVLPMSVYGTNLALNWAWSPIFFLYKKIKWAFYEIAVLWGCTGVLGALFYRVNMTAGILIAPYFVWGTYAMALNYSMMKLNPDKDEKSEISVKTK